MCHFLVPKAAFICIWEIKNVWNFVLVAAIVKFAYGRT